MFSRPFMSHYFVPFAFLCVFSLTGFSQPPQEITDPAITSWKINQDGAFGTSTDPDINDVVSEILADVQRVRFNGDMVYIESTGVPSHTVGPFGDGNPAYPGDQEHIFVVPRTVPGKAQNEQTLGLGAIGYFVNGVPLYSYSDAQSYKDMGIWNQVAIISIGMHNGWDSANGHPAPGQQRGEGGDTTPTPGGNMPTPPGGGGDMPTPPGGGDMPTPPGGGLQPTPTPVGMQPTPPGSGGDMPTPPEGGQPTPGGDMPTPPGGGGDMPTPPEGGLQPTPTPVGMQPTPPGSGGDMPTPPEGGQPTPGGDMPTPPGGGGDMPTPPDGGLQPTPTPGGDMPTPPGGGGGQQPPGGNGGQPPAGNASIQALRQGFAAKTSMIAHQNMHENGAPHSHVPAQMGGGNEVILGEYHYHQQPPLLREQLGDDGTKHSPILGFASDGIPIYGPYGYENTDGSGGVVRIEPSYMIRSISQRTTLPDGTQLTPDQYGPDVSDDYPLGLYAEDYEYLEGLGHLDDYNGRFAVTPEYPDGVYAYYTTVDESGESAFPYVLAYAFYGQPLQLNLQRDPITVPEGLQEYNPSPNSAINNWLMME